MHVLVTGAAGLIGSHSLISLLEAGHVVTATDLHPLPDTLLTSLTADQRSRLREFTADLTSIPAVDELFNSANPTFDAVVHVGGVRSPVGLDGRVVHNVNVTSTYNVLYTAAERGVKKMVQASSCNALGLSWTAPDRWHLDYVPVDEKHPKRPEDPYSLSKQIIEAQAESLCRYFPGTRIASIRMHFTRQSITETTSGVKHTGLWAWSSVDAVVRAIVLSLTSEGWSGAQVFHIADDEIFYPSTVEGEKEMSSLDLLQRHWPGRVDKIDKEWWAGKPRRSFFDTSKAKTMLGWSHTL